MKIKKVWSVCFSATGNTNIVSLIFSRELAFRLNVSYEEIPFTLPVDRRKEYSFNPNDLVVIGTPTYAGKVPNKILPDFRSKLHSDRALAVCFVTFGNRSYDNALAELNNVLIEDGFNVVAAGAFVCEHSFSSKIAEGRPNRRDFMIYKKYAWDIIEKLRISMNRPDSLLIPGNPDAPYYIPIGIDGKPTFFLKAKPLTDLKKCTNCGDCARLCPMRAINFDDPSLISGICIKCQACVQACCNHAKYFDDASFLSHKAMLEHNYMEPKENEFYL